MTGCILEWHIIQQRNFSTSTCLMTLLLHLKILPESSPYSFLCQYDYFNSAITTCFLKSLTHQKKRNSTVSILQGEKTVREKMNLDIQTFDVVSTAFHSWLFKLNPWFQTLSWFGNLMNSVCQVTNISSSNSCHTAQHTKHTV